MKRRTLMILTLIMLVALAAVAYAVFRTPQEASAPIEAVPLAAATTTPLVEAATNTPAKAATNTPAAAATDTPAAAEATPPATETPAASGAVIFELSQDQSQARFIIDEVLRGSPKTVIGATNQVAAQISIDPANPAATKLGTVTVDARTLTTDNNFRNRAIKNQILDTNTYEFVTFEPTKLVGLPDSVTIGAPFTFQVTGNLTVRNVTQEKTFDVTVTPVSATEIKGLAKITFPYRDFKLSIPDSPAVNTVEDNVTLELEFVALAK